jgi:uncharacterized protein
MPELPALIPWILLAVLLLVLGEILRAVLKRQLLVPRQPRRPLEFDWVVLSVALAFILLNVVSVLVRLLTAGGEDAGEKSPLTSLRVEAAILTNFVIIAILVSLILARRINRLVDYGIDLRGWLAEIRFGGLGFLASLPLVVAVIVILGPYRSQETQNSLLILLRETGSKRTILEVVFAAVVTAPLAEELLFRVILQGLLETRLSLAGAIAIPACVFAAVHGPYDALPLLPLALVLGALYHLRRSYVANVTTHALFNATFLILALWQRQSS